MIDVLIVVLAFLLVALLYRILSPGAESFEVSSIVKATESQREEHLFEEWVARTNRPLDSSDRSGDDGRS